MGAISRAERLRRRLRGGRISSRRRAVPPHHLQGAGKEGGVRLKKLKAIMRELDELMDRLEVRQVPAKPIRAAAE